jgi:flagellar basal-body rod protein FlgG
MRALWTAATGMTGQQMNVDIISNNLSNVNTTAYKKDRVEFKDLVYSQMSRGYNLDTSEAPAPMQVGFGAAPTATLKDFSTGTFAASENPTDIALDGSGFFTLRNDKGDMIYTRDGSFKISTLEDERILVNSQGFPVLDETGEIIKLEENDASNMIIATDGRISFNIDGEITDSGMRIGVVQFANVAGLQNIGNNNYISTAASGQPVWETDDNRSTVMQNYLEGSNVDLVDEMVNLIVAQRAYEINSKIVQASDDMLSQANNIRR